MARGTIKDKRIVVEICDIGLEGDAPELGFGGISIF